MAAKLKSVYICSSCGYESAKWNGRCPSCGEWNTFEEEVVEAAPKKAGAKKAPSALNGEDCSDKVRTLSQIDTEDEIRYSTGAGELDRVLGGGLVKGSLVLLGGEPGIGKSTLLLQICSYFGREHTILYVSGEESVRQVKLRADRLGVVTTNLYLLSITDAESVCSTITASSSARVIPHIAETAETVTAAQRWNLILRSCLTACITPEKAYVKLLKKAFSSFSIGCEGNVS